jgi:hypothetical protein
MFGTNAPAFGHHTPGTLDLEISNPAILLNEIARRYESLERILMEYIDNALDDAEALYRDNRQVYPYPIHIRVTLDPSARTAQVMDNCQGMNREALERLVHSIGDSRKLGITWVNGRFGFGVHAFRAAADSIRFQSKHAASSLHELVFNRTQMHGIREARRLDAPFPGPGPTGTLVTLTEIDREWMQGVTPETVRAEIECHFERLLARPGLTVAVAETGQPPRICQPLDYTTAPGTLLQRRLEVSHSGQTFPVEVCLLIGDRPSPQRRPVFTARARRVATFAAVKPFVRRAPGGSALWDHPNLSGYVEVGELVEPALNRDGFVRTRRRQLLFEALIGLEPELRRALQDANSTAAMNGLAALEALVGRALPESAGGRVRIVDQIVGAPEARFTWQAGTLLICAAHPDFQSRLGKTRNGSERIPDRLAGYLAVLIANARANPDDAQRSAALADQILQIETRLRRASK